MATQPNFLFAPERCARAQQLLDRHEPSSLGHERKRRIVEAMLAFAEQEVRRVLEPHHAE